ncbi:DUF429 domain-containing protein [Bremerella alba]|uniref:DUF429 domain-containing protein n=1 Tax=Bremerella alba TaxID=980252 RepID=A0A7V8V873_9BACT|nr:DUF429 domain-containing protein [Bremerella alba]MBA2116700.1 hypothetical protein [Bremerella alba]
MARNQRTYPEASSELEETLIDRTFDRIDEGNYQYAAIGIDMAASESRWGFTLITLDEKLTCGTAQLLLPHRFTIDGFTKTHPIKPSRQVLISVLAGLQKRKITTAVAVDVPFGWPVKHGDFAKEWNASDGVSLEFSLPERDDFEYRKTDLMFKELLGSELFSVGADKIASAAYEWAQLRIKLERYFKHCDVGFANAPVDGIEVFETYPAAFVRLNYPGCEKFKSGETKRTKTPTDARDSARNSEEVRIALFDQIQQQYQFNIGHDKSIIDLACSTSASDAFDGFLCAVCAWDYLKYRRFGTDSHRTSTPNELIGQNQAQALRKLIEKEGWILVRIPNSK